MTMNHIDIAPGATKATTKITIWLERPAHPHEIAQLARDISKVTKIDSITVDASGFGGAVSELLADEPLTVVDYYPGNAERVYRPKEGNGWG